MFHLKVTDQFKRETGRRLAFSRQLAASVAPALRGPHAGGVLSLTAIAFGAALMFVNMARERHEIPVVQAAPPAPAAQVKAVALDPPKPLPVAAEAPPAPEKAAMRIDTSPVAAIPEPVKAKPKHKHHPKKAKSPDSQP